MQYTHNLQLITPIRKNMKNKLILRKRSLIETINDQLKNIFRSTQVKWGG